jgi:hypothetical protein
MRLLRFSLIALLAASVVLVSQASSHREAPITSLDHKADITDWFAFVSYDDPRRSPWSRIQYLRLTAASRCGASLCEPDAPCLGIQTKYSSHRFCEGL